MSLLKRKILSVVGPRLTTNVQIDGVHMISEHFRFIDLKSDAFRGHTLTPGEKIQINTGDWNMRTYTPVSVDPIWGRMRILAYLHGNGPGSVWASSVKEGDVVQVHGPSRSLRLNSEEAGFVFFGDETALAVGANLKRYFGGDPQVWLVFEASQPDEVREVISRLGLADVEVVAKGASGALSDDSVRHVTEGAHELGQVIMTGRAQSIQQMRKRLQGEGFGMGNMMVKAYWSEGKAGLD